MIGLIATLPVKPGMGADLEAAFAGLAAAVRSEEPGCSLYTLVKTQDPELTYVVMELYASDEALAAHGKGEQFRAAAQAMGPCLAGRPIVKRYEVVV
ncbi:MAG: putative quinol monooxygenase [Caulobacterales bacterium]